MNKIETDKIYSMHEKAFFEETNKLLFGEIFTQFFNEKSVFETREINLKEKEVSSNIKGMSAGYTMVFGIQNLELNKYEAPRERVGISIYCCGRQIMGFSPIKSENVDEKDDIKLSININYTRLSFLEKGDRALLDLVHDFGEKISQYQMEKIKKEAKEIIAKGNENLKKDFKKLDEIVGGGEK